MSLTDKINIGIKDAMKEKMKPAKNITSYKGTVAFVEN